MSTYDPSPGTRTDRRDGSIGPFGPIRPNRSLTEVDRQGVCIRMSCCSNHDPRTPMTLHPLSTPARATVEDDHVAILGLDVFAPQVVRTSVTGSSGLS